MNRQEILGYLKEMLQLIKPSLELSTVNDDTQLVSDLGLDSLTILLLGLAIENKFGSQVNIMKGALEFQTVGDVIDFIMQAKS